MIVSISGAYTKSVDSLGVVNIPNHDIGIKEIDRVMQMANHNANIPNEYDRLHVLPYNFKVDEQEHIEDPLGMSGSRLEVQAHIITAQKSSLSNLKKAVKSAGVEIDNIVLCGYASAISVVNQDEKELGVVVIDLGGASCNMVIHSGNSIRHNDFLGVGSVNITNDLSMALHTPPLAAENVKLNYGSFATHSNELIELPILGDENSTHEVALNIISNVILARVDETFMILAKMLEDSGFKDQVGAGIVLTGGLTKLEGIRDIATTVFDSMQVRIAKPRELDGLYEGLRDPSYATAIGLIMYGAGDFTPYEIDSNRKMRYKDERIEPSKNIQQVIEDGELDIFINESDSTKDKLVKITEIEQKDKGQNPVAKMWHRLTELF